MKNFYGLSLVFIIILASCQPEKASLKVGGLQQAVEILRDTAGVNHIYAQNEHDLFFAQGYSAAKDRLFQFEIWRRQATGTVAEILGPQELKRDIGSRLFKFRGNLEEEMNHYHPRGSEIITAFTDGVNAYISETERDTSLLTMEFRLLGIKPGRWTQEVVLSRHQGLLGNITEEVRIGRAVAKLGPERVRNFSAFEPGVPILEMDSKINKAALFDSILTVYTAFRAPLRIRPSDLLASAPHNEINYEQLAARDRGDYQQLMATERETIGSNNWIVAGAKSESGFPILANDPHRDITAPSLRYMVHLVAPQWNVVGGGEPTIPGVSIGHNQFGAWGLTVFYLDGEDLYVYELNPENDNQYKYQGKWEDMEKVADTIRIKGKADTVITHSFTRHGPVTYVDTKNHVGYAVRCAWLEKGGAPYLASLRIDQATSWEEFREGCSYSHIPGENMIWADKKGNIGWQAVGIAPVRRNWSGLVPVPGDGSHEWSGYLPIKSLPNVLNPASSFLATANENNVPADFKHMDAVGLNWATRYRVDRIKEVLGSREKHSVETMCQLQSDYLSLPARELVPLLSKIKSPDPAVEKARVRLLAWNYTLDKNSVEATIYAAWEKKLSAELRLRIVPPDGQKYIRSLPLKKVIQWLVEPGAMFGNKPAPRDQFLLQCLEACVRELEVKLGNDQSAWQYGQPAMHHVLIKHLLSNAVDEPTRKKLEVGPLPRGGYGSTPGVTTNNNNQTSGASFRMVVDTGDWDKTLFTNTPGQSGDPESPYYRNLFQSWASDRHFPVYFSRDRIEQVTRERTILRP
ncbi:MAG: penicillin acylase family protein [Cytophagales bacterium]|nr:penicillin acylase family protein [Cytophagales bacterium]